MKKPSIKDNNEMIKQEYTTEKIYKRLFNLKISLILIVLLIGVIMLTINNSTHILGIKKTSVESTKLEISNDDIEVGQVGKVSQVAVISRTTGTGPFDNNNDAGNDMNASNNIVRSFDQVIWTIENTFTLKDPNSSQICNGGVLQVKAELPAEVIMTGGLPYAEWDISSMGWAENAIISEDGRTFTADYALSKDEATVPGGKQTLTLVLKILGAPNGLEIAPTITTNLAGNNEDEKYTITVNNSDITKVNSPVTVSATPKLNVQLKRNTFVNYKSYFDFFTGNEADNANNNTVYGRLQGYGLTIQLYSGDGNKKLKGIELPKGEITFDLKLSEVLGNTDVTEEDGYTPVIWDYKENINNQVSGKNGRNMNWQNEYRTRFACTCAPYNKGENRESVYDGGDWTIVQDANNPYIYHVTVKNYKFEPNNIFPTNDANDNSTTVIKYSVDDGIGCFSSGYIQAITQIPEQLEGVNSIYMKVEAYNIKAKSISNQETTIDQNSSDDIVNTNITIKPNGKFNKDIYFEKSNKTEWGSGDSSAFIGYSEGMLIARANASLTNDKEDYIYGLDHLIKFDGEAIEPTLNKSGKEYTKTVYTGANTVNINILYAAKKNKMNWESDEEMIESSMEDLIYFDTIEELKQKGYICVGAMIESEGGYWYGITDIIIPYTVKTTAIIGNVYQMVSDIRIYNKGNAPDRTTQTHTLTTNKEDYPTPRTTIEHCQYVKTQYDENGQINDGSHYGGIEYGDSLLIVGATQNIKIKSIDSSSNVKVNYDLGKNENIATLEVSPSITNNITQGTIDNVTLKIEVTLPKGLKYQAGSSDYDEPEITVNENGTSTLVWYKYNCKVNDTVDPIKFNAEIDQESENGKQYKVQAVISEQIADGDITRIGNGLPSKRTANTTIQIINLASYSLYKTTSTPVIERDGTIKYKVTAVNKTDDTVNAFQLLDILPYNGDGRGTDFNGTYKVSKIDIKQTNTHTGESVSNSNLNLRITEDTSVRNGVTSKDTGLGTSSIWNGANSAEEINKELTAYTLTGALPGHTKIEIEVIIETRGNKGNDKYINSASAQTNTETEEMTTGTVKSEVIKRLLDGKVWFDSNANGVIDNGEELLEDINVTLLNDDGTIAKDVDGTEIPAVKTDSNGFYKFEDMTKGKYKVQVEYDTQNDTVEVTKKEFGSNKEINNKFNSGINKGENKAIAETDIITKLNSAESPIIKEEYVNAGLKYKDTKVVVHHYIINSDGTKTTTPVPLSDGTESTEVTINGRVNDDYTTDRVNTAEYYEYVEDTNNTSGTMTKDIIEVIYYYKIKQYPYTVKYYDKDTMEEIKTAKTVTDKDYQTVITVESEKIDIEKYDYDSSDVNGNSTANSLTIGTNADENVINLYYIKKKGTVITKYIDKNTGNEISGQNSTTDKVDEPYTTEQKTIEGYTFIEDTGNTTGTYTLESATTPIEVIYYYRQNAKVIVNHIDKITGEKIPEADGKDSTVTQNGYVGDSYTSTSKEFTGYTLVESPEKETVTMTAEDIVLNYYYKYVSAGVIEKHIALNSDDTEIGLLYSDTHTGNEGDSYNIPSKTFEGYELIEDRMPTNATGTMTRDLIEVIYYYRQNAKVIVNHIDKITGEKIPEADGKDSTVTQNGYVGDSYTSTSKEFTGYTLVESPEKETVTMTAEDIVLNYYYKYVSAGVIEKHIALKSDDTEIGLLYSDTHTGNEGDSYNIPSRTFEGYELIEDRMPTNATGTMTRDLIEVIYYYRQNAKVIVNHIDKITGEKIPEADGTDSTVTQNGYVGDSYTSTSKNFAGYILIESPENETVTMTAEDIVLNYYYNYVSAGVIEKHIALNSDDTEKGLLYSDSHTGNEGDSYNIPSKTFEGYELVEDRIPTNATGTMTRDLIEVIYYYKIKQYPYTVKYYDKDTMEEIKTAKTVTDKDYQTVITVESEKIDIEKYDYDSSDVNGNSTASSLTIGTNADENVINLYYIKKKGTVITKYIDKDTGIEIAKKKETTDKVDADYTTVKETIEGYTFVEDTGNTTGKYTLSSVETPIEVIYYYKKKASVVVHHYIIDENGTKTTTKVPLKTGGTAEDETINGKVGDKYETNKADVPDYYEFVEVVGNETGTMTDAPITVTYYYKIKKYPYKVNYYEKGTTTKIKNTKDGEDKKYGTEITVASEKIDIAKYYYDSADVNGNNTVSKLTIGTNVEENVINLYYIKKKGNVVVKYIDKTTGKQIAEKIEKSDKIDEKYTTEMKEIAGYTFIEDTGNTTGTYTLTSADKPIEVIYYYKQNAKVIVKHIDKATGEEIPEKDGSSSKVIYNGLVGESYTSTAKDFTKYTLVESPENETVTMTASDITLTYYYSHASGGVIEKHIDNITGELLDSAEHTGNEGDPYDIPSKTFKGYELVSEKKPTNAKGTMARDIIEVKYYYNYPTKVIAKYVDKITGKEIPSSQVTKNGYNGEKYKTEQKEFEGYDFVEVKGNTEGTMTKETITVTYYYVKKSAGVIENHYDIITGKKLLEEKKYTGHEGDPYETTEQTIDGYDLVEEKRPTNAKGKMEVEIIKVDYYYNKRAKLIVRYIDKLTGEEIIVDETNGHVGDEYSTEQKSFDGYDFIEVKGETSGKMEDGTTEVKYYYIKKSEVEVKYLEEGTDKVLATREIIKGHVGDEYETSEKTIEEYDLVEEKRPTNTKGKMEDETIKVTYYYKKRTKVIARYIDKLTGKEMDANEINGHVGDKYYTEQKTFDGYDFIEVEGNATGKMGYGTIEIKYYYIKKSEVEVRYLEEGTDKSIATSEIIKGHVGDKYKAEKKTISGYEFVRVYGKEKDNMREEKLVITYYYKKIIKQEPKTETKSYTPKTGDKINKYYAMFGISALGLYMSSKTLKRKEESNK